MSDESPIHLKFKGEFGVVDALSASTAASVVFSVIYNYGYYGNLQSNFLLWFTLQDLLIASALAFFPTFLLINSILVIIYTITHRTWFLIACSAFLIATGLILIAAYLLSGATDYLGRLSYSLLAILGFVFFIYFRMFDHRNILSITGLAAMAYGGVSGLGDAKFMLDTSGYEAATNVVMMGDEKIEGRIISATSSYVFVFDGQSVTAYPLAEVASIKVLNVGTT